MLYVSFPKDTGIKKFPHLIMRETGLMEFICEHGVGHPAVSSAKFKDEQHKHEPGTWSIHGCDGCCHEDFPDVEFHPAEKGSDLATLTIKESKDAEGSPS